MIRLPSALAGSEHLDPAAQATVGQTHRQTYGVREHAAADACPYWCQNHGPIMCHQRIEAPIPPLRRPRCTETDSIRTAYVFYANRWYHKIRGTAGTEPGTTKTAATKPLSAGAMAQTFPTLAAQYTETGSMRTCVLCEPFYANQW